MKLKRLFYKVISPFRKIYWFIFRPKTYGVKVILRNKGKFLLIRNSYGKKHWTFPGGGIKKGEASEDAARRELLEEVGIVASTLTYLDEYRNNRQYKRDTVHCFFAETDSFYFKIDNDEIEEAGWFYASDIPPNRSRAVQVVMGSPLMVKMQIKSTLTNHAGKTFDVVYNDADSLAELEERKVSGVHAYCFYKGKMVVVFSEAKGYWGPPGGGVEAGETVEEAVAREVKEETNMRVISQRLIGFQDVFEPTRMVTQTRSACIVEPFGPFEKDPDGDVTEIKLIDPKDCKKYFDWGEVGARLLERALSAVR